LITPSSTTFVRSDHSLLAPVVSRDAMQPYCRISSVYFSMDWLPVGVTIDRAFVKAECPHEKIVGGSNILVNE
jgi:hypothetical protein